MGVGALVDKIDFSSRSGEKSNRFNSSPPQLPSVQLRYGRSFSNTENLPRTVDSKSGEEWQKVVRFVSPHQTVIEHISSACSLHFLALQKSSMYIEFMSLNTYKSNSGVSKPCMIIPNILNIYNCRSFDLKCFLTFFSLLSLTSLLWSIYVLAQSFD